MYAPFEKACGVKLGARFKEPGAEDLAGPLDGGQKLDGTVLGRLPRLAGLRKSGFWWFFTTNAWAKKSPPKILKTPG